MPRTARVAFPSLVYHIISRGNNREWVFNEGEDFEKYLGICRRYREKFEFKQTLIRTAFHTDSLSSCSSS